MNEFERVRLHPHLHGLVAVYGDFFHVIFRDTIYSLLQDFAFTALEISTVAEQNKVTITASRCSTTTIPETALPGINPAAAALSAIVINAGWNCRKS
jgi:hypothetical protein